MNDQVTAQAAVHPSMSKRRESVLRRWLAQWDLQSMAIPSILFLILFSYVPMWGVLLAFKDYDLFRGFIDSPWAGMKYFNLFFSSPDFWLVMRNTLIISLLKLVIVFPAPIVLALMMNEVRMLAFKRIVQTVTYLPHFLSWVIVGGFAISLLAVDGGSLNGALLSLNLIDEPVNWLSTPSYFYSILISANVWKDIGFNSIVYLAAIAGVNPNLYEAAAMDGASRLKQIIVVTLPSIMPVIIIFFILAMGNILNAGFEDILVLTNNGNNAILMDKANVIDTYVLETGVRQQQYSYGTAAGLFKSLINVILLLGANYVTRRLGKESLW
ncbi:ABC transporter permease [Paenibacillus sp. GCM10023252]|uniref:ABC transporter permease n=1 Tax=Paenibacillus sp. GCM10023252 TaxID=3252649 RepID=UPI00361B9B0D